jgi:hypothetical protein
MWNMQPGLWPEHGLLVKRIEDRLHGITAAQKGATQRIVVAHLKYPGGSRYLGMLFPMWIGSLWSSSEASAWGSTHVPCTADHQNMTSQHPSYIILALYVPSPYQKLKPPVVLICAIKPLFELLKDTQHPLDQCTIKNMVA